MNIKLIRLLLIYLLFLSRSSDLYYHGCKYWNVSYKFVSCTWTYAVNGCNHKRSVSVDILIRRYIYTYRNFISYNLKQEAQEFRQAMQVGVLGDAFNYVTGEKILCLFTDTGLCGTLRAMRILALEFLSKNEKWIKRGA